MKKITAIFLFFVMMFCSSGFYIAWRLSLQIVKNSQRSLIFHSGFHHEKVIQFIIPVNDLKNSADFTFEDDEDEMEFEYKGQMYDIINQKTTGDSLYISCISDKEEDYLNDLAISQIIKNENNPTRNELPVFKFHLDNYTHDFTNRNPVLCLEKKSMVFKKYMAGNLTAPYLNISSPPPRELL